MSINDVVIVLSLIASAAAAIGLAVCAANTITVHQIEKICNITLDDKEQELKEADADLKRAVQLVDILSGLLISLAECKDPAQMAWKLDRIREIQTILTARLYSGRCYIEAVDGKANTYYAKILEALCSDIPMQYIDEIRSKDTAFGQIYDKVGQFFETDDDGQMQGIPFKHMISELHSKLMYAEADRNKRDQNHIEAVQEIDGYLNKACRNTAIIDTAADAEKKKLDEITRNMRTTTDKAPNERKVTIIGLTDDDEPKG